MTGIPVKTDCQTPLTRPLPHSAHFAKTLDFRLENHKQKITPPRVFNETVSFWFFPYKWWTQAIVKYYNYFLLPRFLSEYKSTQVKLSAQALKQANWLKSRVCALMQVNTPLYWRKQPNDVTAKCNLSDAKKKRRTGKNFLSATCHSSNTSIFSSSLSLWHSFTLLIVPY